MKLDTIFRWGSTLFNSLLFGGIIYIKLFHGNGMFVGRYSLSITVLFIVLAVVLFFVVYFKAISDKRKKVRIYDKESFFYDDASTEFKVNNLLSHIKATKLPDNVRMEIAHRVEYSVEQLGKEQALKNLVTQYQVCIENERFYERVAWQIGAIFVPVSLTLSGVGLTKQISPAFPVVSGFALFITWILLFDRFRTSIRLYRDCAKLIEGMLGMFSVSYVYDFLFEKYGSVVRVWPYLVTLSGFYFNFTIFTLL